MRVFSKKILREYWEKHAGAKAGLQAWYEDALRVEWQSPADIKRTHANASIIADNRVVFNIQGNATFSTLSTVPPTLLCSSFTAVGAKGRLPAKTTPG